jgi:hypothetical protein
LNKKPALDNTASLKTTNILNKKPALDNTPSLKTTKILNKKPALDNTASLKTTKILNTGKYNITKMYIRTAITNLICIR